MAAADKHNKDVRVRGWADEQKDVLRMADGLALIARNIKSAVAASTPSPTTVSVKKKRSPSSSIRVSGSEISGSDDENNEARKMPDREIVLYENEQCSNYILKGFYNDSKLNRIILSYAKRFRNNIPEEQIDLRNSKIFWHVKVSGKTGQMEYTWIEFENDKFEDPYFSTIPAEFCSCYCQLKLLPPSTSLILPIAEPLSAPLGPIESLPKVRLPGQPSPSVPSHCTNTPSDLNLNI